MSPVGNSPPLKIVENPSMKTVAIIQARTGSSRLPGKILLDIAGQPMLSHVVQRAKLATNLDEVVVATTTGAEDDAVEYLCQQSGWDYYRGDEHDVLDRYYQAATKADADHVVRITADCPLIDAGVIDLVVSEYRNCIDQVDYVSDFIPERTFPRGLDVEVFSMKALHEIWSTVSSPELREHVTLAFYKNPQTYRLKGVNNPRDYSQHRWTVDTADDLKLIRTIFKHMECNNFGWLEALAACEAHPGWAAINGHIHQKKVA